MQKLNDRDVLQDETVLAGEGICPGSFGELLQGVLPDAQKFLMHLKIQKYSRVKITLEKQGAPPDLSQFSVRKKYAKSYAVIERILNDHDYSFSFQLDVKSELPDGKGLSSSTADMVASIRALEDALGISFSDSDISFYLSSVEPNDGLHYNGSILYNYISGELLFKDAYIPELYIIGLDSGGTVDTVLFNQIQLPFAGKEKNLYEALSKEMMLSVQNKDLEAVCRISTKSAEMWQAVLPVDNFKKIREFAEASGSSGIIGCHSGTYTGIAFNALRTSEESVMRAAEEMQRIFSACRVECFKSVSVPGA